MIRTLTLREVIERAINARSQSLRVAIPGRVERYEASKQWVDVKPLLQDWYEDEDGVRRSESVPVISQVPVVFPGAGGFRLTFPIQAGDTVLLVFADRSMDKWLHAGGEVDPIDMRTHQLSDAVAIPGLHPFTAPWTGASTSAATLGRDGGPQIALTPNAIELGGHTDAVALASKVDAAFRAISDTLSSLAISGAGPSGAAIAAAFTALSLLPAGAFPSPVGTGSTVVKAGS